MSHLTEKADDVFGQVKGYLATNYEIMRLKAVYKISEILSGAVNSALWLISGLLFIMFLSAAAGFYIGMEIGNYAAGFLYVAGFYLLVMVLFMLFKKSMKRPVMDSFIRQMLKEENEWNQ